MTDGPTVPWYARSCSAGARTNTNFPETGLADEGRTSDPAGYRWRLSSMLWARFAMVSTLRSVINIDAGLPCTAAEIPLLCGANRSRRKTRRAVRHRGSEAPKTRNSCISCAQKCRFIAQGAGGEGFSQSAPVPQLQAHHDRTGITTPPSGSETAKGLPCRVSKPVARDKKKMPAQRDSPRPAAGSQLQHRLPL